ncbi:hypothetical protein A0H81_01832 [Grifola frondosa]|uniref:Uncharacterized protein n=1 Tax=Grifola frondosa TaxID=5627 RepID=A0A1C7ML82_GRIFR|nr:hypothetical protein A0H81_01832 [Grifola frondosa]
MSLEDYPFYFHPAPSMDPLYPTTMLEEELDDWEVRVTAEPLDPKYIGLSTAWGRHDINSLYTAAALGQQTLVLTQEEYRKVFIHPGDTPSAPSKIIDPFFPPVSKPPCDSPARVNKRPCTEDLRVSKRPRTDASPISKRSSGSAPSDENTPQTRTRHPTKMHPQYQDIPNASERRLALLGAEPIGYERNPHHKYTCKINGCGKSIRPKIESIQKHLAKVHKHRPEGSECTVACPWVVHGTRCGKKMLSGDLGVHIALDHVDGYRYRCPFCVTFTHPLQSTVTAHFIEAHPERFHLFPLGMTSYPEDYQLPPPCLCPEKMRAFGEHKTRCRVKRLPPFMLAT